MNHAYLIEFQTEDGWEPIHILVSTYEEFQTLMGHLGRVDNVRWRRLHDQKEFDHHRQHCELRTPPRLTGCTSIEWD